MKLLRMIPVQNIEVLEPRYRDRVALIAKWKVGEHNIITFPKAPSLPAKYYLSGETIKQSTIEKITNAYGKSFEMYAVSLDKLELYEGRS